MATIKEEYVSFETAKLLKEKGFNERLLTYYLTAEDKKEGYFQIMAFIDDKIDNNHSNYCYLAPTLQMAMKWLREEYKFLITIDLGIGVYVWTITNIDENTVVQIDAVVGSYEQACEAAIKYCLENLI